MVPATSRLSKRETSTVRGRKNSKILGQEGTSPSKCISTLIRFLKQCWILTLIIFVQKFFTLCYQHFIPIEASSILLQKFNHKFCIQLYLHSSKVHINAHIDSIPQRPQLCRYVDRESNMSSISTNIIPIGISNDPHPPPPRAPLVQPRFPKEDLFKFNSNQLSRGDSI